jgi:hypothetical protein
MKKQFTSSGSESDGCFRPFVDNPGIYKKIVTDSNVVAQETGVSSLCAFLEFGGTNACLRTRGTVVAPLIEKGLASTRAGTRQNAVDALLWYIELDTPDPVIEDLVPFLSHRMPKLVAATTNALTEIFRAFGAKTVSPKPVMKSIPKLFAHADKNVRAEANSLVIELYKWAGDAISKTILPELKPVQQKELEEQFNKVGNETPHQQRYLKSQQEAMDRQRLNGIEDNGGGNDDNDDEEMEDADPMDLVEPEDVLSKVPQDLADRLSSAKWKDRKEALDELYAAINKPKIQNDDFSEIVRLLAKCMKDANIQVVMVAANCIQCLADGLRQAFARHQQTLLSPVLERTKEKKTNVSEALNSALDSLYKCNNASLTEILEPTLEYLKHKTPQIKIETAKFLVRCLSTTKTCPKPPEVKQIVEASLKLLGDTQEPVRSGGAEILGVLMKMFGERAMNPHLESVDDIKRANIQKFCESATVKAKPEKAKPAPAPASKPPPSAAKKPPASQQQRQLNRSDSTRSSGIARARPQPPQAGGSRGPGNAAVPEQVISKKRLASPIKTPRPARERQPPSELSHETFSEPPPPQPSLTAPTPRTGLTNRGLTGRSLTNAPAKAPTPPQPDNSEIQALKQELEQLRGEKSEWQKEKEKIQWQAQEDQAEKSRLMQEINDLQLKNAQLVEDHTRDILQIKSKETQLVRATSDVDTAKLRINKLEAEVERLQQQLLDQTEGGTGSATNMNNNNNNTNNNNNNNNEGSNSQLRSLSTSRRSSTTAYNTNHNPSSPKSPSMTLQFGLEPRSGNHHRTGGAAHSTSSIRRSIDFGGPGDRSSLYSNPSFYPRHSSLTEDKENFGSALRNVQAREEAEPTSSSSRGLEESNRILNNDADGDSDMTEAPGEQPQQPTTTHQQQQKPSTGTGGAGENWKRAVEVTTQLRARIEAMKARQNRTARS